jgi:hypothetical protein
LGGTKWWVGKQDQGFNRFNHSDLNMATTGFHMPKKTCQPSHI